MSDAQQPRKLVAKVLRRIPFTPHRVGVTAEAVRLDRSRGQYSLVIDVWAVCSKSSDVVKFAA
jgi:hypothetical protein